jgi:hypothetical protein
MDGKRFHRLVIAEKIFFYISESVRATGTERNLLGQNAMES